MRKQREGEPVERDDGTYVFMRAEDRSVWFKLAWFMDKYKVLWLPLTFIIAAFGFDFKTPAQTTRELQAEIDTIRVHQATGVATQQELARKLDQLLKVPCLARVRSDRDLALIGIDCSAYSHSTQ